MDWKLATLDTLRLDRMIAEPVTSNAAAGVAVPTPTLLDSIYKLLEVFVHWLPTYAVPFCLRIPLKLRSPAIDTLDWKLATLDTLRLDLMIAEPVTSNAAAGVAVPTPTLLDNIYKLVEVFVHWLPI